MYKKMSTNHLALLLAYYYINLYLIHWGNKLVINVTSCSSCTDKEDLQTALRSHT